MLSTVLHGLNVLNCTAISKGHCSEELYLHPIYSDLGDRVRGI